MCNDFRNQPERAPKGSLDPTKDMDDYLLLSVESMDSLDVSESPGAAAGGKGLNLQVPKSRRRFTLSEPDDAQILSV